MPCSARDSVGNSTADFLGDSTLHSARDFMGDSRGILQVIPGGF